ncbi:MAG: glycosyltransferase family 2 protein [Nanoarchaeota archaeon]
MRFPKVSFVICTYNCKDYLKRCLKSIAEQDYPKDKIEIVVSDSYSNDGTIEVARAYGARVILTKIRGYMEGKGMPKSIGCEKASGEIIIIIDSDNKLVEKDWVKKMVYPLISDESVNYCICRMAVVKADNLANQYLSLVGTDPFAIYTSLDPQISLGGVKLEDKGGYYVYTQKDFLITGGYYLAIRKKTLDEIGGYSRDVDVAYALAKKGAGKIAIAKNAHLHHLITNGYKDFFRKKIKWGKYYFSNPNLEREFKWAGKLFGRHGKIRFVYEVANNLLFFPAFLTSLRMIAKDGKKAWVLHPYMKFGTTLAYIIAYIKSYSHGKKD